ncbi:MAG: alkylated DNA repair dioxygenase AlkB [Candidatus Binatia bacterium]
MNQPKYSGFTEHHLDEAHSLFIGALPTELTPPVAEFEELWESHPQDFHEIMMHGRLVKTPRWQQAFDRDYVYTGARNNALPAPPELRVFRDWVGTTIDSRLNGFLVNWYDGKQAHYIGRHRDSPKGLTPDAPIATISLGEERTFRMRKPGQSGFLDFEVSNGSVAVLPWATNQNWTHEVPASKRTLGHRISITLRAFLD